MSWRADRETSTREFTCWPFLPVHRRRDRGRCAGRLRHTRDDHRRAVVQSIARWQARTAQRPGPRGTAGHDASPHARRPHGRRAGRSGREGRGVLQGPAGRGQVTEDQLRKAVAAAGASHVLASSITGMTIDVRVTPGMVSGPGWGPGRGWPSTMGPGWGGFATITTRRGRVRLRPTCGRRRTSTATRGCSMLRNPKWCGRRQRRPRPGGTPCRS